MSGQRAHSIESPSILPEPRIHNVTGSTAMQKQYSQIQISGLHNSTVSTYLRKTTEHRYQEGELERPHTYIHPTFVMVVPQGSLTELVFWVWTLATNKFWILGNNVTRSHKQIWLTALPWRQSSKIDVQFVLKFRRPHLWSFSRWSALWARTELASSPERIYGE